MVVPVIAAAGAATVRVIATRVVTKGKTAGKSVTKNPNQKKYLDGIQKEQGEIHKKKYLASLKKEQQEKQQKELYEAQNTLTTTGDRILSKRVAVQNEYRKKNDIKGYIGRKMLKEEDSLERIYNQIDNGYDLDFEVSGGNTHGALRNAYTLYLQVKAARAGWFIFLTAIPFWVPQIYCWMVGVAGLGSESVWLLSYVIPGETIFTTMNFIISAIGVITMMYAFVVYATAKVNAWSGMKGLVFCFCVAFYCAPFLNFAPWFLLWIVYTTYSQKPGLLTRMVLH